MARTEKPGRIDTQINYFNRILAPTGVNVLVRQKPGEILAHQPWDIVINDSQVIGRVMREGFIGAGEAYMEGAWDCEHIDQLLERVTGSRIDLTGNKMTMAGVLIEGAFNRLRFWADRDAPAKTLAGKHYDLSSEFFKGILDNSMAYTCGYWKEADTLDDAQTAKMDLICRKLRLQPGMRMLDIGGGWGNLTYYAAENYEVNVTNISISEEQIEEAERRKAQVSPEVAERVTNKIQDYRDVDKPPFDRIVSVGMLEHVRSENYRTFMDVARKNIAEDGLMLLHCIGTDSGIARKKNWITKYIFPHSQIPKAADVTRAYQGLFVMEDWHNFGAHYDKTLMEWNKNLDENWDKTKQELGDHTEAQLEMAHRMWNLYLLGCAGMFRSRSLQLWQIVLSPNGVPGGYEAVR